MAIIGIDLGTTNSLAAYWKDGVSRLIPCDNGRELLPSAVSLDENGKYIVGREAKEMLRERAKNTVVSFKRFMGTDKQYRLADKNLTPAELSAFLLQHIRKEAERHLQEPIEEAIITVPAYFNDRQRSDTKKAAQLAGLHVERLINEPSAAALAYRSRLAENPEDDCNIVVFDFGGGTLDLSYVECFENIIEIVAVAGDNHLGGDDIDRLLAEYYCMENHKDLRTLAPNVYAGLVSCAERAKRRLSVEQETVMKTDLGADLELDEDLLFQVCMPLFERIRGVFLRLMRDADIRISDLDALVMVGGSSKLLVVQKFLTELLGKKPVLLDEADRVVAIGAGVYAGIRERREEIRDLMLTDVCPFTLGIDCGVERRLEPIIPRNTTLPAHRVKHFVTMHDFQRIIEVNVYQGEEYYATDNLFLSGFQISVPGAKAGVEGIDIHFTYDINGLLHVEAYNSRKEHKDILIANQELTETELENYKKLLADIEVQPEEQPENKELLDRLTALYENLAGEQKEYVGGMIAYYLRALQRGRRVQIRKIREQITQILGREMFSDEWQEAFRFNGELKFDMEDADWENMDSEDADWEDED